MNLDQIGKIYFLGIGGIGMSALARYFLKEGKMISGYDRDLTQLTKKLEAEGMKIHYIIDVNLIPNNIDLVVYTPAIPVEHQEFVFFKESSIPMIKRSEALEIVLASKRVIAVAGTHGKTSTSAILGHILNSQGRSVTSFVGGIMCNYGSNFIYGQSDWVVIEADEYDRSFLRLQPEIAVIQAMDDDHLDIYDDREGLLHSFREFTGKIKRGGTLWLSAGLKKDRLDKEWLEELHGRKVQLKCFGSPEEEADLVVKAVFADGLESQFDLKMGQEDVRMKIAMPGRHNVMNAIAASAIAIDMGLSTEEIAIGLKTFRGIERRFELVHHSPRLVIVDDYAHHPVEIEAAINAMRMHFPKRHLTVVFQPHLYSRTRDFKNDFARSLDKADEVILVEIYPAREKPIEGVSSASILNAMLLRNKRLVKKGELIRHVNKKTTDLLLVLGAGDIYREIPEIKMKLIDD